MALMLVLLAAASHALQAPRRVARHATVRMATEIVQFTTDLRVEDHGGLSAAAKADAWLPVYCGEDADDARVARALRELDAELRDKYDAPLRVVRGAATSISDVAARVDGRRPRLRRRPDTKTEDLEEALGATLRTWTAPHGLTIDPERDRAITYQAR